MWQKKPEYPLYDFIYTKLSNQDKWNIYKAGRSVVVGREEGRELTGNQHNENFLG